MLCIKLHLKKTHKLLCRQCDWPRLTYPFLQDSKNNTITLYLLGKAGGRTREKKGLHPGWQETALETGAPWCAAVPPEHHRSPRRGTCASYPPHAWFCTPSLNLASLKGRLLQLTARTQQQQSQYQCQHLKNYKLYRGVGENHLNYPGFSEQTFAQGNVPTTVLVVQYQKQLPLGWRAHEICQQTWEGTLPLSGPIHTIKTFSLPTHATNAAGTEPPLFGGEGLGVHKEEGSTELKNLTGWQRTWHTGAMVLVQERDKWAEAHSWKGRDWRR